MIRKKDEAQITNIKIFKGDITTAFANNKTIMNHHTHINWKVWVALTNSWGGRGNRKSEKSYFHIKKKNESEIKASH